MKELFYEESSKNSDNKSGKVKFYVLKSLQVFSIIMIIAIALFGVLIIEDFLKNLVANIIVAVVFFALFISTFIVLGRIKEKYCVDYDYTLISGELRISKVIKDVKRVDLINVNLSSVEKIGKYNSGSFNQLLEKTGVKDVIYSSNVVACEGKGFYYIAYNDDGINVIVLECTEKMIYNLLQFTGKKALEEDYKWFILTTRQQLNHQKKLY